ncbi:NAD(P)-dependent oxidoreductase [Pelagerythrobacter aerophilus]|uniref:NAD(P)-dependent oxidoreductase n=1 Tax=Pelagerythrobacter aerophilus TaxID=2306995 RepID=A0A418NI94_9SPHN|nr:NAD(P)-dependent oxidoreductase [Pelagerythrobacter aerophilus]RIV78235.1 NAD(P)-dependent oxidoreductase [Pelagerythrobacter aerophilus]
MSGQASSSIALIGYGEAGRTFANAAGWEDEACAFDVASVRRTAMEADGVRPCASVAEALKDARLVLSLVTADGALQAARDAASLLAPGALFCDMNSVAPDTKRAAAEAVNEGAGRYVDVAVLAPVDPARLRVPLLIAGTAAQDAHAALRDAGFADLRIVGDEIGRASSIKMIRSIMVKGIEALTAEMMIAAERAGVTDEVLASLDASEKAISWSERAAYNLERMMTHGLRRAAEMRESARTLEGLGIQPLMTAGTVRRQHEMAGCKPEDYSR